MSTFPTTVSAKVDKYEQMLTKYDWKSPFPPRGYQFGVGRGAKAFTTSAELSATAGKAAPQIVLSAEQSAMLDALDRLEKDRHKRRRENVMNSSVSQDSKKPKVLLSMEDIATIGCGISSQSLVKRKARTEDMDVVDTYVFDDETAVVTASDLLRSRAIAANQTLENILDMGSSTEQTTWITHSRALREMGLVKKAQQTLIEGSRITGSKGPLIWKEQLCYLQDPASQRRLLEQAVSACKTCEELWLLLMEYEPPHEKLHWLQQAVMSCPTSENLWLRVLEYVTTPRDQKKIIRKALEVTPNLPSLWAMLARLENYETGKAMFNAAAAEHLSMKIIIEAAKFEEFHLKRKEGAANDGKMCNERIRSLVQQAAQRFLSVEEERSRREWFETARAAAAERYIVTSAYLLLYFVCDKNSSTISLPDTWLDDLSELIPDIWHSHDNLCAIWCALLIAEELGKDSRGVSSSRELQVITSALHSVPSAVLEVAVAVVLKEVTLATVPSSIEEKDPKRETEVEEEEELGRPTDRSVALPRASTTSATAASQSLPFPLVTLLLRTLLHTPAFNRVEVMLSIAKVFYDYNLFIGAHRVLMFAIEKHPTSPVLFAAAAKASMAMGCDEEVEQLLLAGTAITCTDSDIAWVKLAVHRRSLCGDIRPLVDKALEVFPKSEKLWLMKLESEGTIASHSLDEAAGRGLPTVPIINLLRSAYSRALSEAHCRFSSTVWCYAAVRLESELLSDAGAARALLLQGVTVCQQGCNRCDGNDKRAEILATFGLARCRVELRHGGNEAALDTVKETLQQLPKKGGCFTVPVGELVSLFIDLECPAARGRAAAQAVQQWRVHDPLVLSAVAKLYHAAGKHEKALEQAQKAVKMSEGRCGDAVALWLKLASSPVYRKIITSQMGISGEAELGEAESEIQIHSLLEWLWREIFTTTKNETTEGNGKDKSTEASESDRKVIAPKPNSGPLWIHVAKVQDPSNVTLLGYRDSIETMLQRVMDMIRL
uniref:Uncharacterized protein TCIL3000_11_15690 n=1 Tax=Trypanosoma congolense (strain IL3000) TaxID=1068625 RepID=G0V336_TRYCI|nr:unnamed protein product [Trypanosoma congolense IL3000]